jgi:hypothetical protein
MKTTIAPVCLALSLLVGCSNGEEPAAKPPVPANEGHAPSERKPLGSARIGSIEVRAFQLAAPVAGDEGDFDLVFAEGQMPDAVRGWVGNETAQGSRRTRFTRESAVQMHGHPEIPSPLDDGARLWIEIEVGGARHTGSFDLVR